MRFLPGLALLIAGASATEDEKTTTTAAPAKLKNAEVKIPVTFNYAGATTECADQALVLNMISVGTVSTMGATIRGKALTDAMLKDKKSPIFCDDATKCEAKSGSDSACFCRQEPDTAATIGGEKVHKDLTWDKTNSIFKCGTASSKTDDKSTDAPKSGTSSGSSSSSSSTTAAPTSGGTTSTTNADCVHNAAVFGTCAQKNGKFVRERTITVTTPKQGTGTCPAEAADVPCLEADYNNCVVSALAAQTGSDCAESNSVCVQNVELEVTTEKGQAGTCHAITGGTLNGGKYQWTDQPCVTGAQSGTGTCASVDCSSADSSVAVQSTETMCVRKLSSATPPVVSFEKAAEVKENIVKAANGGAACTDALYTAGTSVVACTSGAKDCVLTTEDIFYFRSGNKCYQAKRVTAIDAELNGGVCGWKAGDIIKGVTNPPSATKAAGPTLTEVTDADKLLNCPAATSRRLSSGADIVSNTKTHAAYDTTQKKAFDAKKADLEKAETYEDVASAVELASKVINEIPGSGGDKFTTAAQRTTLTSTPIKGTSTAGKISVGEVADDDDATTKAKTSGALGMVLSGAAALVATVLV